MVIETAISTATSIIPLSKLWQRPTISLDLQAWPEQDEQDANQWDLWFAIDSKNHTNSIVKVDVVFEYKTYKGQQWKALKNWDINDRYLLPGQGFHFPKNLSKELGRNKIYTLNQTAFDFEEKKYISKRDKILIFRIGATAKFDSWWSFHKFEIPTMRYFYDFKRKTSIPWFKKDSQFDPKK